LIGVRCKLVNYELAIFTAKVNSIILINKTAVYRIIQIKCLNNNLWLIYIKDFNSVGKISSNNPFVI